MAIRFEKRSEWYKNDVVCSQDGQIISSSAIIEQRAIKKLIKNQQIHTLKAKALKDLCIKPLPGEQYRIITEKQFNAFAFLLTLLESEVIEEMYLAIYRINEPTVTSIIDYIVTGKIKKASFVISNFFNQTKKPEKWAIKLKMFCDENENCHHAYVHNHAKVVAAKTQSGFYVFEGSGNMSDNARIEQYIYENCEQSFLFHKNWITELTQ